MKLSFIFAWYDLWIGFFWDQKKRWLYFFPVPCFGVIFKFNQKEPTPVRQPVKVEDFIPQENECFLVLAQNHAHFDYFVKSMVTKTGLLLKAHYRYVYDHRSVDGVRAHKFIFLPGWERIHPERKLHIILQLIDYYEIPVIHFKNELL